MTAAENHNDPREVVRWVRMGWRVVGRWQETVDAGRLGVRGPYMEGT